VPWVEDAADAERAVQAVKYGPRGSRGLAGVRAADYGQRGPLGDYVRTANEETLVIVHVESAQAVERVDEIAAVDGVDVIFLGPTDLSHSLGVPGEVGHPLVAEHLERAAAATLAAGKVLGVTVPTAEGAVEWLQRGARYVTTGIEPLLGAATRTWLERVRSA
jgi:4-hydroxy-2-oxoheptanedioate aldolase